MALHEMAKAAQSKFVYPTIIQNLHSHSYSHWVTWGERASTSSNIMDGKITIPINNKSNFKIFDDNHSLYMGVVKIGIDRMEPF